MLRAGVKRRRSKAQVAEEKEEAIRKQAYIEQRLNKAEAMEARFDKVDGELEAGWRAKELLKERAKPNKQCLSFGST